MTELNRARKETDVVQPKLKVKVTFNIAVQAQKGDRCIALPIFNPVPNESRWQTPRPGRFNAEKPRRPLHRRLGGPQDQSGRAWKIKNLVPPSGFQPRTVQPVASCYADYGIPAPSNEVGTTVKSAWEDWGKQENLRIVGVLAKIRTGYLPNTSQKRYRLQQLLLHHNYIMKIKTQ